MKPQGQVGTYFSRFHLRKVRGGPFEAESGLARRDKQGTLVTSVDTTKKEEKMDKYRCTICDYLYDPEAGDTPNGVAPGTAFADLPDTWVCPICGAEKSMFEKV
jgi:rubredoxin